MHRKHRSTNSMTKMSSSSRILTSIKEEEYTEWSGHIYGWSSCSLFNYAKCYVRSVERIRMYPGKPPRERVLQAEASEVDRIELDANETHPYLSVMFENFDADVVFS